MAEIILKPSIRITPGGGATVQPGNDGDLVDYNAATGDYEPTDAPTVDKVIFDTAAGETSAEGQLSWDATNKTLSMGVEDGEVSLGQEAFDFYHNLSGVQLVGGDVVSGSGASGNRRAVVLCDATDPDLAQNVIGMVTVETINNNAVGRITTRGPVRNLDTSDVSLTEGLPIYVDPDNPGKWIQTVPTPPAYRVYVGVLTVKHATEGVIDIKPYLCDSRTEQIAGEPTGFVENSGDLKDIVLTYDDTARTITVAGDFVAYDQAERVDSLVTGWESDPHDAGITSNRYLYYNGTAFTWATAIDIKQLLIAFVIADSTGVLWAQRECHGLMPWQSHYAFHHTIGTYKESGGTLSGYVLSSTTAAERRPATAETIIDDEDLETSLAAHAAADGYTQLYLSGTSTINLVTAATDITRLSGAQPLWNEFTGGAWTETGVSTGDYAAWFQVAIPTTSDAFSAKYRYIWVQPQAEFNTLAAAQTVTPADVNLGDLTSIAPEFVFINRVIMRYIGGDWSIIQVDALTGNRYNQSSLQGGFISSVVTDGITIGGNGTATAPVQSLISGPGTAQGQVAFWDATAGEWVHTETTEDFWDDVNKRRGIGTATPGEALEVGGNVKATQGILPVIRPDTDAVDAVQITKADGTTAVVVVDTTNSRILAGSSYVAPTLDYELAPKKYVDDNSGMTYEITQAATDTLTAAEMKSTIISNYGQTVENTQTLPAAAAGLNAIFTISTTGAGAFHIKAGAGDKIYLDGTALDDGDKVSCATPAIPNYFQIFSFRNTDGSYDWQGRTGNGAWTDGGA